MTPEGITKRAIKKVLDNYRYYGLYDHWPVPYGYGKQTIDCLGCFRGRFFGIEAKAPGKRPTGRQNTTLEDIRKSRGKTFVIDGTSDTDTVEDLEQWFTTIIREDDDDR